MRLTGKVIAEGDTLPFASIGVTDASGNLKSSRGTSTDMDGKYSIDIDPSDYLTVKFMGYSDKTVKASEVCKQNSCNFDIDLGKGGSLLNEVVITATKNKPNWKKIALISGISIIGLTAIYFGIKRLRK